MAIVFSILMWMGFLGLHTYLFFPPEPSLKDGCTYFYQDEEYGEEGYYTITNQAAKDYGMTASCLTADKIPAEAQKEAIAYLKKQNPSPAAILPVMDFYLLFFLAFAYMSTALAMAHIRLNGIKISPKQYASFYKIYEETAKELGLKTVPNAYIIHSGGALNAFAVKISHKKMVVFYADLIEALVEGEKFAELHAVAAHELTHIKLKHINYGFLLIPFRILPFLGSMLSRARELSADKGALAIVKDHNIVAQALLKVVTGKFIAKEVSIEEYINQPKTERGFFIWLSKITSSHPSMPERIKLLQK